MSKIYIYALKEKGTAEVRYVGKTANITSRLSSHLKSKMSMGNPKREWIESVTNGGGEIELIVLSECEPGTSVVHEKQWISHFIEKGARLTNTIDNIIDRKKLDKSERALRFGAAGIEIGEAVVLKVNAYDSFMLNQIAEDNPELPEAASLIRRALRSYQIEKKLDNIIAQALLPFDAEITQIDIELVKQAVLSGNSAKLVVELIDLMKDLISSVNYIKAKIDGCESLEDK